MTLEGSLDAFGVAEVLEMLGGAAKTGRLRVEGDGGRATVRLRDGAVISAVSDRASGSPPDEVICDMLRYERGSFAFEADDGAEADARGNGRAGRDRRQAVPALLARAGSLLAERRELEAVVPSFDHRIGLTTSLAAGDHITISAEQWAALVAVGAGCTVGELAGTLGLDELSALRTVRDLVTAGLTTVRATGPRAGWKKARDEAEPSSSRRANHTRPALPARDTADARDGWPAGRDEHDEHVTEARAAASLSADSDAQITRGARDRRGGHDGRFGRSGEHPGEAGEPEDGFPRRRPEPERGRRWPDPPPLGSRG